MSPLRGKITSRLLKTGQTTIYAIGDDADANKGIAKLYLVLTAGQFSGTMAIYLPTLARNDIAFVNATSKITAAAGLGIVKTGDVIRIRGSALNNTEFIVATGGVATEIITTVAPADEGAGAWITIAKQALQSNNVVQDLATGKMWSRYGTYSPVKLGVASDGKLSWTATAVAIHPAAVDLQMIGGTKGTATVKIIGGAGEVLRYWAGYTYSCTGFANAVNNYPGMRCISVTVNGADLDIVLDTGNQTCISEAAAGARAINLGCNGVFGFVNAAIAAGLAGYSDWRIPNMYELYSIADCSTQVLVPAFPSVPLGNYLWSSTTPVNLGTYADAWSTLYGCPYYNPKNQPFYVILCRGGV